MATTVRITETYDLKTTVGELGILGVHTPSTGLIKRLYPGLVKNHRFMRLNKCDVTGVCASVLPADPLSVGVESGDVAPEDLFNPILYKPVSNESFEAITSKIYNAASVGGNQTLAMDSLDAVDLAQDPFNVYYAHLAENKKWKKAMPQNGFGLRGLYPICYQMINTYGNTVPIGTLALETVGSGSAQLNGVNDDTSVTEVNDPFTQTTMMSRTATTFRGKSVKMPKFPLHYGLEYGLMHRNMDNKDYAEIADFVIPKTYVALFLIPPARLHEFYYRMRVSWTITFSGVMSAVETDYGTEIAGVAADSYGKNFSYSNAKTTELENSTELVDSNSVQIKKIMES